MRQIGEQTRSFFTQFRVDTVSIGRRVVPNGLQPRCRAVVSQSSFCREFFRPPTRGPPLMSSTATEPVRSSYRNIDSCSRVNGARWWTIELLPSMSTVQQRKAEILAKRAKLAELKKQRELRQKEFSQNRASVGDASEVPPTSRRKLSVKD